MAKQRDSKANKYKLEEFLQQQLESYQSTLKETSWVKHNKEYLCSDETTQPVYDFDKYVEILFGGNDLPASPDAIYIGEKQLYFVEFKNQKISDIHQEGLENKFIKGTKILNDMLKEFIARDCQYFFCVVHKSPIKPRFFDSKHIQESTLRSKLEELNKQHKNFYDKIFVNDVDFYKKEFTVLRCL